MKRYSIILMMAAALVSCGRQDDVYKEFIVDGGYVYPAKVKNLSSTSGFRRVVLEWDKPLDPSLRTATVYWDNYSKSLDLNYSDFPDGHVTVNMTELEDRSYTFDVVNFDGRGNRSLPEELSATPFGDNWLVSHTERSIVSAEMTGDDATVVMTKSTLDMVATKFRYQTVDGKTVESDYLSPDEVEIVLPGAQKGTLFEFKSAYLPTAGVDTVWTPNWSKATTPIVYPLPVEGWKVTVTKDQEYQSFTCDKILDGIVNTNNRWHSARTGTNKVFPKILSIDTGMAEGEEYAFTRFALYQNPSGNTYRYIRDISIYVGSQAFDPDDQDAAESFGKPVLSATLNRAEDVQSFSPLSPAAGRYFAILFPNSFNGNGYLDLWELVPYGYRVSDVK